MTDRQLAALGDPQANRETGRIRSPRRGFGHPALTLVAVTFGLVMVVLDNTIVSVANPTIGRHFNASLGELQWVTSAYLLALAGGLITGGRLGDRFGRKRIFLIGTAGFALASLACGLSGSLAELIAFRAVQGCFGALLFPQTLAILRATFPPERLAQAVGIWGGASAIATASGPIIGGALVESVSWSSIFFVNVPVGIISLLVGGWVIRESRDLGTGRSIDLLGVVLLSGGLFSLIWALIDAETAGWGNSTVVGFLAAAVVLLAVFTAWQRVARTPLIPLAIFRSRQLSAGLAVLVAAVFALFGVIFYLTLYLQRIHGDSPITAGISLLPLTGVLMVSAPVGGWIVGRIGPRLPLTVGFVLVAIALIGLSRLEPHSAYLAIGAWLPLIGIAFGAVQTGGSQAVVGSAPRHLAGVAAGLQATAFQVGGVLGTTVLGTVVASRVASVYQHQLIRAGVPGGLAHRLQPATATVAEGLAPRVAGTTAAVSHAITAASLTSFTSGLQLALEIGAAVALAAAAGAFLLLRSGGSRHRSMEQVGDVQLAA
ncbi:MAG TPA: MFS transporter [Verrucomicrobiae bacterium]|nr:MFS transporter [Verrucomicrobiae bacterium]